MRAVNAAVSKNLPLPVQNLPPAVSSRNSRPPSPRFPSRNSKSRELVKMGPWIETRCGDKATPPRGLHGVATVEGTRPRQIGNTPRLPAAVGREESFRPRSSQRRPAPPSPSSGGPNRNHRRAINASRMPKKSRNGDESRNGDGPSFSERCWYFTRPPLVRSQLLFRVFRHFALSRQKEEKTPRQCKTVKSQIGGLPLDRYCKSSPSMYSSSDFCFPAA